MVQKFKEKVNSFEFTGKEVEISSAQEADGMGSIFPPFCSKISALPSEVGRIKSWCGGPHGPLNQWGLQSGGSFLEETPLLLQRQRKSRRESKEGLPWHRVGCLCVHSGIRPGGALNMKCTSLVKSPLSFIPWECWWGRLNHVPHILMLKSQPLGPQNVTEFTDRTFREGISLKWRY